MGRRGEIHKLMAFGRLHRKRAFSYYFIENSEIFPIFTAYHKGKLMRRILIETFAAILVFLNICADGKEPRWKKTAASNGITVYIREVPGSEIREIKAEAVIKAPARRTWKVICDFNHYKDFMAFTKESEITHQEKNIVYFYSRLKFGWGIGDRFYTIKITLREHPDKKVAYKSTWELADKHIKKPKGNAIAVPVNKGYWLLYPEGADKTRAVYYLYTDPGGEVPAFIANLANRDAVPRIIKAVRRRIKDKRYDD